MGLTHYWWHAPMLDQGAFTQAVADCRKMMAQIGVPLGNGSDPAVFSDDLISFNGIAPHRCESFVVPRTQRHARPRASIFSFTKTNRLPYDLCVRVALIILQHHLDHAFRVASDDTDWESARALCQEHLDYGREFTLKR